jgi:anthranilate phosphoribosyltransferase
MIQEAIVKLLDHQDLSADEARKAIEAIMEGQAAEAQIAALLIALRMKGETAEEIAGAASAMRDKVTRVHVDRSPVLDVVGTGGDELGTFNISTAAAIVSAAAGAVVAKHGNRSVSSTSGSADVLQELGVNIQADVPTVEACIRQVGVGFCFAPLLHTAMKHAMPVRKALGVPTVFNVLGPLTNPAGADRQLLGVGNPKLTERMAQALLQLGTEHAFVVHSEDGLDEVTLTAPTHVWEIRDGRIDRAQWTAADFGLPACRLDDLKVGSPAESAAVISAVLRPATRCWSIRRRP